MIKKVTIGTIIWLFTLCIGFAWAGPQEDLEKLGGFLFKDKNLSLNQNQSCMTCHHPVAGFADPENLCDPIGFPVSDGSDPSLFGGRNAPSAAYAGFSPILHQANGNWVGGMFWDGRATGEALGDPLAEQALGPFLNPVEMALTIYDNAGDPTDDPSEVVARVETSKYAELFEEVFSNSSYGWTGWEDDVYKTYDLIGIAIAAFERSKTVTRFNSTFDKFRTACREKGVKVSAIDTGTKLAGLPDGILTATQLKGLALFNDPTRGNCAACHPTTDYTDDQGVYPPLFTDFTYDNLGIPTNPRVEDLSGVPPPDLGLGGFLGLPSEDGKFKVPTLRNVANSAPYGHNGYFATLKDIVNFYNTRGTDVDTMKPQPEVVENVNTKELGDLGLTPGEVGQIVAFLKTLTDQR